MTQMGKSHPQSTARGLLLSSVAVWVVLAAIATTAGIARELWLVPRIGDLRAHQVGTLVVGTAFLAVIAIFVEHRAVSRREALAIGMAWLAGAMAFEFGFGHFVDGLPWSRLLSDYDLSRGRLLLLVWLTVGLGPFVLARKNAR